MNEFLLRWQPYHLFPYERELGLDELGALLRPSRVDQVDRDVIRIHTHSDLEATRKLTYFETISDLSRAVTTFQSHLEASAQNGDAPRRQATRYSSHGLHEYKGKFNPQTAHCLINVIGIPEKGAVLDPFCGSGTTLVECIHSNVNAVGIDINPLAVFIANAKIEAIKIPAPELREAVKRVLAIRKTRESELSQSEERFIYLNSWFTAETLDEIETIRRGIESEKNPKVRRVLSVIASDLLRDNSLQEPMDLRIRRRKELPPYRAFGDQFKEYSDKVLEKLAGAQGALGPIGKANAVCRDSAASRQTSDLPLFDGVISSPPYATALPYIDTQRLSLVWLGLVKPSELPELQANLTGSREFSGKQRSETEIGLERNLGHLPPDLHKWCLNLQKHLTKEDGFRRQAMPLLLYRYFTNMLSVFAGMKKDLRRGARIALVIGHNHTTLGGTRIDIDTPTILGTLAEYAGYSSIERMTLQAYQRYGMHQRNAVSKEEILFFRKK